MEATQQSISAENLPSTYTSSYRQEVHSTVNFMLQREGVRHRILGGFLTPSDSALTKNITNRLTSALLSCHPEWNQNPPSQETLRKFLKGVAYLPPMGGKTPLVISQVQIELPTGTKDVWYRDTEEEERLNQLAQTFGLEPSRKIESMYKRS